ncbi:hypothetical protein V2A60_001340 [Cordyceps javanica]
MSLADRISLQNAENYNDPEDFFGSGLGTIFPDEELNLHGEPGQSLVYISPHLSAPLVLRLCDPTLEADRTLFSHYLWNASLLLAELIEADTLGVPLGGTTTTTAGPPRLRPDVSFSVAGRRVVELGSGAGLGSTMAGLVGARRVVATDYPSETVLAPLRDNVRRGVCAASAPRLRHRRHRRPSVEVEVEGHAWGALDDAFSTRERHAFDRVVAADVLWMPRQHANLRRSVDRLLSRDPAARAWIVGALHTGRAAMALFLDPDELASLGLAVEHIWERDCHGVEREWNEMRDEDAAYKKRWLVMIVLKRI